MFTVKMLVSAGTDLKFHSWPNEGGRQQLIYTPLVSTDIVSLSWSKDHNFLTCLSESARPEIISVRNLGAVKNAHVICAFDDVTAVAFARTTKRRIGVATSSGGVSYSDLKGLIGLVGGVKVYQPLSHAQPNPSL